MRLTSKQGFLSIVASVLLLQETYPPRLLELKTRRLRKETGNDRLRSKYDKDITTAQLLRRSLLRPMIMLLRCPIVGITSLFLAIAYSYMYLLFTTFTDVFESTYGFNAGQAGLSYLGLGIGFLLGQYTFDLLVRWRLAARGRKACAGLRADFCGFDLVRVVGRVQSTLDCSNYGNIALRYRHNIFLPRCPSVLG
jgi:hypothetical protein